jgi:2-polyprenyl-3-methyl-5-hydroxy-6-metoxy-1,4-benzoquinol methylase
MKKIDWNKKQEYFFDEFSQEEDSEEWLAAVIKPSHFISKKNTEFFEFANFKPNSNILEVGSGRGELTLLLLQRNLNVVGLDISKKSLDILLYRANLLQLDTTKLKLVHGTIEDNFTTLEKVSFDYVVCMNFLHHVDDMENTAKNMFQLLGRWGKLIFLEPNGLYPFWRFAGIISHGRFKWELEKGTKNCTRNNFINILNRLGADEVEIKPIAYFPAFITNKLPKTTLFLENVLKSTPIISNFSTGLMVKAKKD